MTENLDITSSKPPILFIIFNRLEISLKTLSSIRDYRPDRLYIACDGPRNIEGEKEKIDMLRIEVLNVIDWPCEVFTKFEINNLGCKVAVSSAIDWFFLREEMGIILEDDCLPEASFFDFCKLMLERYKNDTRVMMVAGTNYMIDIENEIESSYFYSRHFMIWGWATWKRAWDKFDISLKGWKEGKLTLDHVSPNKHIQNYYRTMFNLVTETSYNTWDIQWVFTCLMNNGLCVTSSKNLISNIGVEGTHTTGEVTSSHFLLTKKVELKNLRYNSNMFQCMYYDNYIYNNILIPPEIKRVRDVRMNLIKSIFKRMIFFGFWKKYVFK